MLRESGGGLSSRFSCVTSEMGRLSLDLLRAVKIDKQCALEVGRERGGVLRLWNL